MGVAIAQVLGSVESVVVMGRNALRKSLSLAAENVVGEGVHIILDVTQVLFAAVQVGLNPSASRHGGDEPAVDL
jgi:hypothetical protein